MGTYQWVYAVPTRGPAVPYPGSGQFYSCPAIVVPAGAQIKRMLVRNVTCQAVATGNGYNAIGMYFVNYRVHFTAGQYGVRDIFLTNLAVPAQTTAVYDVAATERIYTTYLNGADRDLGWNQRTIFGKVGGASMTILCDAGLNCLAPALSNALVNFYFGYQFGILYYL
jgi:hypothetical protein